MFNIHTHIPDTLIHSKSHFSHQPQSLEHPSTLWFCLGHHPPQALLWAPPTAGSALGTTHLRLCSGHHPQQALLWTPPNPSLQEPLGSQNFSKPTVSQVHLLCHLCVVTGWVSVTLSLRRMVVLNEDMVMHLWLTL